MLDERYADYAQKIWKNCSDVSSDRRRWHSSGYHISENSLTIDDALEDAFEALDIIPTSCGIDIDLEVWQDRYMEDPEMLSAMASVLYNNLKRFGKYSFKDEPDWDTYARDFLES